MVRAQAQDPRASRARIRLGLAAFDFVHPPSFPHTPAASSFQKNYSLITTRNASEQSSILPPSLRLSSIAIHDRHSTTCLSKQHASGAQSQRRRSVGPVSECLSVMRNTNGWYVFSCILYRFSNHPTAARRKNNKQVADCADSHLNGYRCGLLISIGATRIAQRSYSRH